MGIFEHFPYTNFHDLNLDKILERTKEAEEAVETSAQQVQDAAADMAAAQAAAAAAQSTAATAQNVAAEALRIVNESIFTIVDVNASYVDDTATIDSTLTYDEIFSLALAGKLLMRLHISENVGMEWPVFPCVYPGSNALKAEVHKSSYPNVVSPATQNYNYIYDVYFANSKTGKCHRSYITYTFAPPIE